LIKFVDLPETVRCAIDDLASKEVAPEWLGRWVSVERRATSLLTFEPLVIPGLLQTPEYARAVLRLGKESGVDLEAQISERLDRPGFRIGRVAAGERPRSCVTGSGRGPRPSQREGAAQAVQV
jgi:hypothetical protein